MKIEKLSDCSVKIVLSQIDLYNYDIQYDDWDSDKATEFILSVADEITEKLGVDITCLLYTSPSTRDPKTSRMPSSA